jgi:hypothetical protein
MAEPTQQPIIPSAPKPETEICGNCAYYKPASATDLSHGQCRRYPPQVIIDPTNHATPYADLVSMWPNTNEVDNCGEYRYLAPTE